MQTIQFDLKTSSDGTRFPGETRDCTVRAISNAFDVPYEIAHKFMAKNGRKNKHGVPFITIIGTRPRVLFGRRIAWHKRPKKTIGSFVKSHSTGTYIISLKRHVFVLKDGVIIDTFRPNINCYVQCYYYISKPKSNESSNRYEELGNSQPVCEAAQDLQASSEQLDRQGEAVSG